MRLLELIPNRVPRFKTTEEQSLETFPSPRQRNAGQKCLNVLRVPSGRFDLMFDLRSGSVFATEVAVVAPSFRAACRSGGLTPPWRGKLAVTSARAGLKPGAASSRCLLAGGAVPADAARKAAGPKCGYCAAVAHTGRRSARLALQPCSFSRCQCLAGATHISSEFPACRPAKARGERRAAGPKCVPCAMPAGCAPGATSSA